MNAQPIIGIGNTQAQQKFMSDYKKFLDEWPSLRAVITKVFLNRTIEAPSKEAWEKVSHLPDDAPEVRTLDDKYKSDVIVFTLGRIAVDDFSELVLLVGNGWGVGALKVLRGMYERIVTSGYIAKTPEACRPFADSFWTHRLKLWNRISTDDPTIAQRATSEVVETIKAEGKAAQARKNVTVCKACGQLKAFDAWTPLDLVSMARIVGKSLEDLYAYCYLDPTAHMHATGAGMSARIEHTDEGWRYKLGSAEEAKVAMTLGHLLILQNLRIQNEYFKLGLEDLIQKRLEAYSPVWDQEPPLRPAEQRAVNLEPRTSK